MTYRCPNCNIKLTDEDLMFIDVSGCPNCGKTYDPADIEPETPDFIDYEVMKEMDALRARGFFNDRKP